ncbi:MAG TPA: preprotein translocase subunit SecG [Nitrospirae bacterium]|nr:preprotein translocase subunit SecG [Nitrospirota bacterium]
MITLLIVVHIIICLLLIGIVLIQGGKGAELGSAFGGGSSQTIFGGRGAATFMNKLTTGIAVAFMITSLILTVVSVKQKSVVRSTVIPEGKSLPAAPQNAKPETDGVKPQKPEQAPSAKPDK